MATESNQSKQLLGRVAIVTGAGRGIGRAISLAYAREGAVLSLAARTEEELEETARQVRSIGTEALVVPTDVSDIDQVNNLVQRTMEQYSSVDILVNNAGIAGPVGPLQENDPSYWVQTIQVNLIGTYLCCRAVLPAMVNQDRGKIINLTGAGGQSAWRFVSAYGTSKAAVVRLTETLALELAGKNVYINVMAPGAIRTYAAEEALAGFAAVGDTASIEGWHSLSERASIEQATDLAVFLASDASKNLNGRFISAWSDEIPVISSRLPEIMSTDAFTLRRVDL